VSRNKQTKQNVKLLDICIPVFNRFDLLTKCLNSIPTAVNGKFEYNVILVDNGSNKDEAREFYGGLDGSYTIIRNQENFGFPKACNQGAKRKASPLLLFLNSDVILWDNSLAYMVEAMDDPKVGVCGMKLLFPEDLGDLQSSPIIRPRGKVQHVGLAINIRTEVFHQFLGWDADHPKVNAVREVDIISGAVLLTRRSIWNKVGGFLEIYGLGNFEDVEYCLSVRELGLNVIVETKAVGYHYTGASAEAARLNFPFTQNRLIFLQRWQNKLRWSETDYY